MAGGGGVNNFTNVEFIRIDHEKEDQQIKFLSKLDFKSDDAIKSKAIKLIVKNIASFRVKSFEFATYKTK